MYRSTTPTIILHVKNEDFDLSLITICHVTIESENGSVRKVFENPTINVEEKTIMFTLTQAETAMFNVGNIKIQIKAKLESGAVIPSKIVKTTMNEILEEEFL